MKRLLNISIAMLLLGSTVLHAELMPIFEMDRCVGDAKLIVHGFLDEKGNVKVRQILKGERPPSALTLADGAKIYQWLLASMKGEIKTSTNIIEVVAFLRNQTKETWQPVMGYVGVAGMEDTNVYLFSFGKEMFARSRQPTAWRDEHFNREGFLTTIRE